MAKKFNFLIVFKLKKIKSARWNYSSNYFGSAINSYSLGLTFSVKIIILNKKIMKNIANLLIIIIISIFFDLKIQINYYLYGKKKNSKNMNLNSIIFLITRELSLIFFNFLIFE